MTIEEKMNKFIEYALFDDIGDLCGIKKNAPESAKRAYEKFVRELEKAKKNGVKV